MPPSLVPIYAPRILGFIARPRYVYEPQLPRMFCFLCLNLAPGVLLGNQAPVFLAFLTFSICEITDSQGLGGRKVGVLRPLLLVLIRRRHSTGRAAPHPDPNVGLPLTPWVQV